MTATPETIAAQAAEIARLLDDKLGARGPTLSRAVARAGRRLPRRVARAARNLARAAEMAPNPRLLRQVDAAALEADHRAVAEFLTAIDPAERRRTAILRVTAGIAANLLLLALAIIGYLAWRGQI